MNRSSWAVLVAATFGSPKRLCVWMRLLLWWLLSSKKVLSSLRLPPILSRPVNLPWGHPQNGSPSCSHRSGVSFSSSSIQAQLLCFRDTGLREWDLFSCRFTPRPGKGSVFSGSSCWSAPRSGRICIIPSPSRRVGGAGYARLIKMVSILCDRKL